MMLMTWHKKSFVKFIAKFPLLYNIIDRYVQALFLVLDQNNAKDTNNFTKKFTNC